MDQERQTDTFEMIYERDHLVQIYNDDNELIGNLKKFMGAGIVAGNLCIVIADAKHRKALDVALTSARIDIKDAKSKGTYVILDAEDTLKQFMVNGLPDKKLFYKSIGQIIKKHAGADKSIRAFGEMVALLWKKDEQAAAILLEQYWNEIIKAYDLTLFCAYPMYHFQEMGQKSMLHEISKLHSCTITPKLAATEL